MLLLWFFNYISGLICTEITRPSVMCFFMFSVRKFIWLLASVVLVHAKPIQINDTA